MNDQMWGGEAQPIRLASGRRGQLPEVPQSGYAPNATPLPPLPHDTEVVTVQSQQPLMVALLRGAIIALIAAGVNLFTALQLDFSVRDSFVSAALVFFTVLQARGFAEGVWDNWRAEKV